MSFPSAKTLEHQVSPARCASTLASMGEKSLTMNLYPGRGIKAMRISSDRTAGTETVCHLNNRKCAGNEPKPELAPDLCEYRKVH